MIFLLVCFLTVKASTRDYYTASVFEYKPVGKETQSISKIVSTNLLIYDKITTLAAEKGSDIIVFPEYGLYPFFSREIFKTEAQFVPDPTVEDWNPCIDPQRYRNSSIVKDLSCMARKNNIFLVSNFLSFEACSNSSKHCPYDKIFLYNTNVVFDRTGKLVARYHKYHLIEEAGIDAPDKPEFVTFDTDFGRFGTFVCFDILWEEAVELFKHHKIDSIVFTSWWKDHFPDFSSIQVYYFWSLLFDINLIASNKNIPGDSAVGSGIFRGSSFSPRYVYNPDGKAKLILSKVPLPGVKTLLNDSSEIFVFGNNHTGNNLSSGICSSKILGPPKGDYDYRCVEEDTSNFTMVKLKKSAGTIQACNKGLCCILSYKIANSLMEENYYLLVNNGSYNICKHLVPEEMCGVTRCDNFKSKICSIFPTKATTVFEKLSISANFSTKYVYPNILASQIKLLTLDKWSFDNVSLHLVKPMDEALLSAFLLGRRYNPKFHSQEI